MPQQGEVQTFLFGSTAVLARNIHTARRAAESIPDEAKKEKAASGTVFVDGEPVKWFYIDKKVSPDA